MHSTFLFLILFYFYICFRYFSSTFCFFFFIKTKKDWFCGTLKTELGEQTLTPYLGTLLPHYTAWFNPRTCADDVNSNFFFLIISPLSRSSVEGKKRDTKKRSGQKKKRFFSSCCDCTFTAHFNPFPDVGHIPFDSIELQVVKMVKKHTKIRKILLSILTHNLLSCRAF